MKTGYNRRVAAIVDLTLGSLLCGCISSSESVATRRDAAAARESVSKQYRERASNARSKGDLAVALDSLIVVEAVTSDDPLLASEIEELRALIDSRVEILRTAALAEFDRGNSSMAVSLWLQAIALRPDDRTLQMELASNYRLIAESRIVNQPRVVETLENDDGISADANGRAELAENADALFEAGIRAMSESVAKARNLFTAVLRIDPTHLGARAYLDIIAGQ